MQNMKNLEKKLKIRRLGLSLLSGTVVGNGKVTEIRCNEVTGR